jgi:hypothetical protein
VTEYPASGTICGTTNDDRSGTPLCGRRPGHAGRHDMNTTWEFYTRPDGSVGNRYRTFRPLRPSSVEGA